jgi:hypothetical protein
VLFDKSLIVNWGIASSFPVTGRFEQGIRHFHDAMREAMAETS